MPYPKQPRPKANSSRAAIARPHLVPTSDYQPVSSRVQLIRSQGLPKSLNPIPNSARAQLARHLSGSPTADKELEKLYDSFKALWPNLNVPAYLRNPQLPHQKVLAAKFLIGELGSTPQAGSNSPSTPLTLPVTKWKTQAPDWSACFRTCQKMIGAEAPRGLGISVIRENGNDVVLQATAEAGIKKINDTLASGKPIIVGVNIKKEALTMTRLPTTLLYLSQAGLMQKVFIIGFLTQGRSMLVQARTQKTGYTTTLKPNYSWDTA